MGLSKQLLGWKQHFFSGVYSILLKHGIVKSDERERDRERKRKRAREGEPSIIDDVYKNKPKQFQRKTQKVNFAWWSSPASNDFRILLPNTINSDHIIHEYIVMILFYSKLKLNVLIYLVIGWLLTSLSSICEIAEFVTESDPIFFLCINF